jgi:hypothetical protein
MDYRFFLDTIEIEEPIGWADFELSMKRDDVYHGIQFLASTGSLRFWGIASAYLQQQKEQYTVSANVTFRAESTCDDDYEEVIEGRLNFGKYKDVCGSLCIVEMPFEEGSCTVTFNNRFDQKVDVDSIIASDNMTVLPSYTEIGKTMPIPAKALQAGVDGSVADDGFAFTTTISNVVGAGFATIYLRPDYTVERYNNIATGQLTAINSCVSSAPIITDGCDGPVTPQLLFEDTEINCFDGNFTYTSRMKGVLNVPGPSNGLFLLKHVIFQWDGVGNIFADGTIEQEHTLFDFTADLPNDLPDPPFTYNFDDTITGSTTIPAGGGFYAVLELRSIDFNHTIDIDFAKETLFRIEAIKLCPASDSQYYMVHEALSRVVENVTNGCIRVKSEYYGRTDSQPYSFAQDGCGGLRMVTSGLKLRNAPNAKIFASPKDLIGGLNAIDNIGFSVNDDPALPGHGVLQIESIEFFYKNAQTLRLDAIPEVSNEIQEALHYAKINVGYKKWEVEEVNGLNEFNSNREMRTNVETVNTTLDIQSDLIAGSYPIELTRQQSFADSGAADTTYDNEIFIICLTRDGAPFAVEVNKVLNAVNIFDPNTIKNYRISPIRNLMRWFKSIVNSYANINTSTSRIFFNSGTGNYTAGGELFDATACKLENGVILENQSIGITNFANQAQATPLVKNEYASFEYPLSIAEWNTLRANPYGYIAYTCGTSTVEQKGFIKEIKYRPAKGMANFILRKKWGN